MRQPATLEQGRRALRQEIGQVVTLPAPVGGLNARDSLLGMKVEDAIELENWYPTETYCAIRGGSTDHATGFGSAVVTLAVHNALDGTDTIFASTVTDIYDVTAAGAIGAAAATCTDGNWVWVNYGDGGTQYLLMFNGVDSAKYYNGSTWITVTGVSSPALTGVTTSTINYVMVHKERLFFLVNNSLSFWYLAAGAVGGALTEFPLESYFREGGKLVACGTWTLDSGEGIDDLAVFVTSQGEVIVFSGTNPNSPSTWSMKGIFKIGSPIGRKCIKKVGGDLVILTESGLIPMSKILSGQISRTQTLTEKILPLFVSAARAYRANTGWTMEVYPLQAALIVNVPTNTGVAAYQYVMNTLTGAWTKFTGWQATDFVVSSGELYFGTATTVRKAWGTNIVADVSDAITAIARCAYSSLGQKGRVKKANGFKPVLTASSTLTYFYGLDVDFDQRLFANAVSTVSITSGDKWDVAQWDLAQWSSYNNVLNAWATPAEVVGEYFSPKLRIAVNDTAVTWTAHSVLYESGAIMG